MHFHQMPVNELQRNIEPIVHVLHSHARGKLKIPHQPTNHNSYRHKRVLVADAISWASTEGHKRQWMFGCDVFGQEVVRIEDVRIRSPNRLVAMNVNDGNHDFSAGRNYCVVHKDVGPWPTRYIRNHRIEAQRLLDESIGVLQLVEIGGCDIALLIGENRAYLVED